LPKETEMAQDAIQAWLRFRPGSFAPREISLLKNSPRSIVFRLSGIGPGGSGIVAKRCPRADGYFESFIYNEVLGPLPFDSLRCYGFVEDGAGEYGWLFLEDGGVEPIARKSELSFAHWLGVLHASTSNLGGPSRLPLRGPAWHLEGLRTARSGLCESVREQRLGDADRSALEGILFCFDVLEQNWHRIEECCDRLPWALVHGDLQPKNIMTRRAASGIAFLPLDWEESGWGPPAVDLAGIDVAGYWTAAHEKWPRVEFRRVEEQVRCGSVLHVLTAVGWETVRLASGSRHKAYRRLQIYAEQISAAMKVFGLEV
jgi:Phosphotransferase enzyme family